MCHPPASRWTVPPATPTVSVRSAITTRSVPPPVRSSVRAPAPGNWTVLVPPSSLPLIVVGAPLFPGVTVGPAGAWGAGGVALGGVVLGGVSPPVGGAATTRAPDTCGASAFPTASMLK